MKVVETIRIVGADEVMCFFLMFLLAMRMISLVLIVEKPLNMRISTGDPEELKAQAISFEGSFSQNICLSWIGSKSTGSSKKMDSQKTMLKTRQTPGLK